MSVKKYKRKVDDVLDLLEFQDTIEVKWIDACKVKNATLNQMIRNRYFATYKRQVGSFYSIRLDGIYRQRFLIFIVDSDKDGKKHTFLSIPVVSIMRLIILTTPTRLKIVSENGDPYLAGGEKLRYRKHEDGIGEHIDQETPK